MEPLAIKLTAIRFLGTGIDGGHTYIRGKADHSGEKGVDVYVHFATTELEDEFQRTFNNGAIEVESPRWEVLPAIGLSLWDVSKWKFLE